ncbi:hypothetical protein Taro_014044 [Colocasia esculenta]|uniref:Fructose-1-6-bisphosphatase class I N-terminal domain-containing protein n=1 Tax=Colocasia esculenta TaxID=4460 RepID=A0A843UDF5_COLES|nr:hypothetical protein [Colocasia esculenta]
MFISISMRISTSSLQRTSSRRESGTLPLKKWSETTLGGLTLALPTTYSPVELVGSSMAPPMLTTCKFRQHRSRTSSSKQRTSSWFQHTTVSSQKVMRGRLALVCIRSVGSTQATAKNRWGLLCLPPTSTCLAPTILTSNSLYLAGSAMAAGTRVLLSAAATSSMKQSKPLLGPHRRAPPPASLLPKLLPMETGVASYAQSVLPRGISSRPAAALARSNGALCLKSSSLFGESLKVSSKASVRSAKAAGSSSSPLVTKCELGDSLFLQRTKFGFENLLAFVKRVGFWIRWQKSSDGLGSKLQEEFLTKATPDKGLIRLLVCMGESLRTISFKVRTASCGGTACVNSFGDEQLAVDLLANKLLFEALQYSHFCNYACSEEVPELQHMEGPGEGENLHRRLSPVDSLFSIVRKKEMGLLHVGVASDYIKT